MIGISLSFVDDSEVGTSRRWVWGSVWLFSVLVMMPVVPGFGQVKGGGMSLPGFAATGSRSQPQIKIDMIPQYSPAGPGQKMFAAIVLDIPKPWHLYANPRQGELGIDTEVVPQPVTGLRFGKVIYPQGRYYEDKTLNASNRIYVGRAVIFLPLAIEQQLAGRQVTVKLNLSGLMCSDLGTCLPWNAQAQMTLEVAADISAAKANRPDLFAGVKISSAQWPAETVATATGSPGAGDANAAREDNTTGNTNAVNGTDKASSGAGTSAAGGQHTAVQVVMPDYQPVEFSDMHLGWIKAILVALAAGFLLNLMPCVLPVIPIKVLSLIQQSQNEQDAGDKYKPIKLALVFSFGILLVFVALAVVMSVFKLLYGQQFQSSGFKLVMLLIIYTLALSMFGLFEISLPGRISNINIVRQGYAGALGMGILATLLATPCSAPLLGPVLMWSLSKPLAITIAVFLVVGTGMAVPYVILTAFPNLLHKLPKAGNWMIYLKQGLGFVMLAVAVYLIFLFPPGWHFWLFLFCLILGFALWLGFHVVKPSTPPRTRLWARCLAGIIIIGGITLLLDSTPARATGQEQQTTDNWLISKLLEYHKQKQTVMVEFTADWCPNCKYVELTVLNRDAFRQKLQQTDTTLVIADWTHKDPAITELLKKLGSAGIPFSAVFPGNDPLHPIVLRDIYTLGSVLKVLDIAAGK